MNAIGSAILELKKQCEILGEDLYAIEIGEKTVESICDNSPVKADETHSKEGLMHFLGAKIYIYRKPLREFTLNELLQEIANRDKRKRDILEMMMTRKTNP